MAHQPEHITITIVWPKVEIEYHPATLEAEVRDKSAGLELGLNALAQDVIRLRVLQGLPVPDALIELGKAETWREFR